MTFPNRAPDPVEVGPMRPDDIYGEAEVQAHLRGMRELIWAEIEVMTPDAVSRQAVKLSVLLSSISSILADKDRAYHRAYREILDDPKVKSVSEADVRAKDTEAYNTRQAWTREFNAVLELIQSLKKRWQQVSVEFGQARNL